RKAHIWIRHAGPLGDDRYAGGARRRRRGGEPPAVPLRYGRSSGWEKMTRWVASVQQRATLARRAQFLDYGLKSPVNADLRQDDNLATAAQLAPRRGISVAARRA